MPSFPMSSIARRPTCFSALMVPSRAASKRSSAVVQRTKGSGSQRRWSYRDTLRVAVIRLLVDNGMELRKVRRVVAHLDPFTVGQLQDRVLVVTAGAAFTVEWGDVVGFVNGWRHADVYQLLALDTVIARVDAALEHAALAAV